MEDIPTVIESTNLPVDLPIRPYLNGHCVNGQVVFPAVEAMEALAQAARRFHPKTTTSVMSGIGFDKFLPLDPAAEHLPAFIEVSVYSNGDVNAALRTKTKAKHSAMARVKTHAGVTWPHQAISVPNLPLDVAAAPEGYCCRIPNRNLYPDLVSFGPSYRNVLAVHLAREGAVAEIRNPVIPAVEATNSNLLGSPFALDAVFHVACAWGQRFAGIVAFPVGIDQRRVYVPTRPGETYFVHVLPVRPDPALLVFDLRIYNRDGGIHEACTGVRMRDVSGGKLHPPNWIRPTEPNAAASRIAGACKALAIIELDAMAPFAEKALSEPERHRVATMSGRRRKSYLAARLACKRLSRRLSDHDMRQAPQAIMTIGGDRPNIPCCPLTDGRAPYSCSVSHDDRFAIAVAADRRVGIDVERVSERVLTSRSLYMSEPEQALVRESHLGEAESAVRIWSIKEAVTKALDISLADAWQRVKVSAVGSVESRYQIDGQGSLIAVHDSMGSHVITLV